MKIIPFIILCLCFVSNCVAASKENGDQMEDVWYTYPVQIGEHQAWITYNHGYSEIAKTDKRNKLFSIRLPFHNPTEYGMPKNEEFAQISQVDEHLDSYISAKNGVYLGRITMDRHRLFYFYVSFSDAEAKEIIKKVSIKNNYKLQFYLEEDKEKSEYWSKLFPTLDDSQVIKDSQVLEELEKEGDKKDIKRVVDHWAYFDNLKSAEFFMIWAKKQNYKIVSIGPTENQKSVQVRYTHVGSMNLADITYHTIMSNRKARELNGEYDGWETSVEKK